MCKAKRIGDGIKSGPPEGLTLTNNVCYNCNKDHHKDFCHNPPYYYSSRNSGYIGTKCPNAKPNTRE
jgi:hypothetical protein